MNRWGPVFKTPDVQMAAMQIDDVPLQGDPFGDTQTMPEGDQDERGISMGVPARRSGSLYQPADFLLGEVFTRPHVGAAGLSRRRLSRKRCLAGPRTSVHIPRFRPTPSSNSPENGPFRESPFVSDQPAGRSWNQRRRRTLESSMPSRINDSWEDVSFTQGASGFLADGSSKLPISRRFIQIA